MLEIIDLRRWMRGWKMSTFISFRWCQMAPTNIQDHLFSADLIANASLWRTITVQQAKLFTVNLAFAFLFMLSLNCMFFCRQWMKKLSMNNVYFKKEFHIKLRNFQEKIWLYLVQLLLLPWSFNGQN